MLRSDRAWFPIQNKRYWRYFGIFIVLLSYLLPSYQLGRALFAIYVRDEDGFSDQIAFVQEGIDLDPVVCCTVSVILSSCLFCGWILVGWSLHYFLPCRRDNAGQ